MSSVLDLVRPDILSLRPYEHATWDPSFERLHANELPWRASGDNTLAGLNRYPEPQPRMLVERLAALYDVSPDMVLAGRGSDEAIDLLVRTFCRAGEDGVVVCPPTFGMYAVAARIQGASVVSVPLVPERGFALDEQGLLESCAPPVKIVFLCSPNNPTGNLIAEEAILRAVETLTGRAIVVVDEAYIEFAEVASLARLVPKYSHLAVLRTLSKAHGLAGARCGTIIANPEVIAVLRKVIPPYAIPQLTLEAVLKLLEPPQLAMMRTRVATIRKERARLESELGGLPLVARVWPSHSNFLLVEFRDVESALARTRSASLLIRDVRSQPGLRNALRITVGTPEQNDRLLESLR